MKKASSIIIPLMLWGSLLFGQSKFTATVSKTSVSVGERFEVDFSVKGNADQFAPPDMSVFQVLAGPNMYTNQMVNKGDTTVDITYGYILVARKEGSFTIGSATIVLNAQELSSNSLNISVEGTFPPHQQQPFQIPVPFAAKDSSRSAPFDYKTLPKQIFIRVDADKTHVYVGDSVNVTYKLYTRIGLDIANSKLDKVPTLKGLRNRAVGKAVGQMAAPTTENVNNIKYMVSIITQFVVIPEHSGDLTIGALAMSSILKIPEKGTFDNPSGSFHHLKYELKSAPLVIHAIAPRAK